MDTITQARNMIKSCLNCVSFSGAGLSAESGVATFRDIETDALWANVDPMKMASPEGFASDPQEVLKWYNQRRQQLAQVRPNPAHHALAQQTGMVHITQNVDHLLEAAGANPKNVHHLHGQIQWDQCNNPFCDYHEEVDLEHAPPLRHCPHCNDYLRPAVVWFGETLPESPWRHATIACEQADVLLVIGTSAAIYPAANLIPTARQNGAKIIIINTHPSEASHMADCELIGPAGDIVPQLFK